MKKKIYRAGVIPFYWNDGEIRMLFMRPSNSFYGGDEFQIAKGHVEDGEDDKSAALREGLEEVGLLEENIKMINNLGSFLGRTTVFICEVFDPTNFAQFTSETSETKWMSPQEFAATGRAIHIPIIEAAVERIHILSN